MGLFINIDAADGSGSFKTYHAAPKGGKGPAVIVLQEIFGVNPNIRTVCDWLAVEGFHAFAPDMFWRQEPDVELDPTVDSDFAKARALLGGFDRAHGLSDIQATIDHARTISNSSKVGATGYCMGGFLAYMSAAHTDIDAAAGYYGVRLETVLSDAEKITRPLILHIAEEDSYVDKDAQKKIHAGLSDHPLITLYNYAGADHGFARHGGAHYSEEAAMTANKRTIDLFRDTL